MCGRLGWFIMKCCLEKNLLEIKWVKWEYWMKGSCSRPAQLIFHLLKRVWFQTNQKILSKIAYVLMPIKGWIFEGLQIIVSSKRSDIYTTSTIQIDINGTIFIFTYNYNKWTGLQKKFKIHFRRFWAKVAQLKENILIYVAKMRRNNSSSLREKESADTFWKTNAKRETTANLDMSKTKSRPSTKQSFVKTLVTMVTVNSKINALMLTVTDN